MKTVSLHHKRLMLVAIMFTCIGPAIANGPAFAQQAPAKWKPAQETITITAAPASPKTLRDLFTGSTFGDVFMAVSASVAVPYSDLDLAQEPGAAELARRINVAASLVCRELAIEYPATEYPVMVGDDCEQTAARDGQSKANAVIAAQR